MKTIIKKALNSALTDGSVFQYLPIYGDNMTAVKMAIAYTLKHSGFKLTSSFLENYLDSQGHITADGQRDVAAVLRAMFEDSWDRKWAAITAEYNPIHNYDRTELTIDSKTGADTDQNAYAKKKTKNEYGLSEVESTGSVKGFNSSVFTDANKDVTQAKAHTDNFEEDARTDTLTHSYDSDVVRDSHIEGNVGVTKTQEMIEDEFRLRSMNFYDSMFKDIDSYLALHVYGNQKETVNLSMDMNISVEQTDNGAIITVGNQSVTITNGTDGKTPILDLRENGDLYVTYE